MSYRRIVLLLVTGMAILIVALAVLLVFQSLFAALGDATTARFLFAFAIACLVMLVVDVLLLVGAVGLQVSQGAEDVDQRRNNSDEDR